MVLHFHVKGKSALWSHLLAFQRECEEVEEVAPTYSQDTNSLSPLAGNDGKTPSSILAWDWVGGRCLKIYGHLATKPSYHQTILPANHLATKPSCQQTISPPNHLATNHLATKPSRHQTISPPNHLATKPSCQQTISPPNHLATKPSCH